MRNELYDHFINFYKRIHKRGILQFHIVFPDNVTFLRVHKPQKYGDDLTKVRYSYDYVNKHKTVASGFEQGKTVHAIRYVFPIFDESKEHLGAVELSLSTEFLQSRLTNSNKLHTHFIVKKDVFEVKKWKQPGLTEQYISSVENDEYMQTYNSHAFNQKVREQEERYIVKIKDQILANMKTKRPFSIYVALDNEDKVKVLSFLPIQNIKDHKVEAYLVSHSDSSLIYNTIKDSNIIEIAVLIVLLIMFFFLYLTLNNKEKLKEEVQKKTQELRELNNSLEEKVKDEIGKLEKANEELFRAEKLASMGEMIGNIAHQWRQPLSVISTGATGMLMQRQYGELNNEQFEKTCNAINASSAFKEA